MALLLISAGIAYIVLNDPPHTFCDTQTEHFRSVQKGVLFKDPKDNIRKKPLMGRLIDICWKANAPGACYEYFAYLRRLLSDFFLVSQNCLSAVSKIKEVRENLFEGVRMMTLLAWRKEVLAGKASKLNWLSRTDMSLFCSVKAKIISFYGAAAMREFEKKLLAELPADQKVSPKRLRKASILSENCAKYPF